MQIQNCTFFASKMMESVKRRTYEIRSAPNQLTTLGFPFHPLTSELSFRKNSHERETKSMFEVGSSDQAGWIMLIKSLSPCILCIVTHLCFSELCERTVCGFIEKALRTKKHARNFFSLFGLVTGSYNLSSSLQGQ